ncbi:uncharacterized protein V1513DRAFT_449328 [Lipomyces chichibuensis]|uniref:uncharacterized protein n=1 Tax=Lipomyces chichibuensis TaxID=1546026 RepID=UPI0033439D76
MGFLTDHPYTAITVTIDRLVTDQFEEDDVAGIFDLIETIRLSPSGPTEAARAIRKKLKYGSVHNQLRALTILDSLIENGGKRFQTQFADEPLLERMRILATDHLTDPDVKKKISGLFVQWAAAYKDTAGMTQIAQLYKQLPQRKRAPPKKQPFVDPDEDMEDDHEHERETLASPPPKPSRSGEGNRRRSPEEIRADRAREKQLEEEQRELAREREGRESLASGSGSASVSRSGSLSRADDESKSRPKKVKQFDLAKEKPMLLQTLAEAGTAATNLSNSLKLINRERELATDNIKATENFNRCRQLRRMVLRYIQHIESEDYIGALIHANEELVAALQLYDNMSHPIEHDSDSEDYDSESESESDSGAAPRRTKSPEAGRRSVSVTSPRKASTSHRRTPSVGHDAPPKPVRPTAESLAHKRKPPPIPVKNPMLQEFKAKMVISKPESEEDDNPFGDSNKIETPSTETFQMTWKDI